jgi:hypothetical protein
MSYNVPIQILQNGSVLNVASGGTLVIAAGGSIQNSGGVSGNVTIPSAGTLLVAGGGSLQTAATSGVTAAGSVTVSGSLSVTGVVAAPQITLGGTPGRWAFGTLGLASGVGSVLTGLTTVVSAGGWSLSGVQGGAGSMSSVVIDPVNFSTGSVIFRGLAGSLAFTGSNGTVAWFAIGV